MSTPLTSRIQSFNLFGGDRPVFSPQTRCSIQGLSAGEPSSDSPLPEVQNEQDVREKRGKRRSHIFAHTTGSPLIRLVEDNQGETAKLTNDQLASHYVNCIKLSTENKITAKNAFSLHLIDHMNEMLKQRCEGTLNFQVAGGTIFASAKIYASRVDAVHSETCKVMSSLGRGANDDKAGSNHESQEDGEKNVPGRKRKKRSKILENNPTTLRMKKMDVSGETDPLDQYFSSVFDVASTSGLLINHLGLCKDGITVRFDSDMDSPMTHNICGGKIPVNLENPDREQMEAEQSEEEDADRKQEINGMFSELVKLSSNEIAKEASACPTLKDFQWNNEHDSSFDWNEARISDDAGNGLPGDNESHPGFDDEDDVIIDSAPCDDDDDLGLATSQDAQPGTEDIDTKNDVPIGMDAELLTSFEPGEYSYFKHGAFSTWEGPNHWKMKIRGKFPNPAADTEKSAESEQTTKGKKRKRIFYADFYSTKLEFDEREFERDKRAKEITKRTREKWRNSKDDRLLPSAGEYHVPDLAKCVLQPDVHIRPVSLIRYTKSAAQLPEVDTDKLGMYNYDNPNDRNNYCPNTTDDEDIGAQDIDEGAQGDDLPPNFARDYNGLDHVQGFPDMTLSQTQGQTSQLDIEAMLKGDHLISHPKKVEKISIAYAKKATRIDVRRLKAAMWTVLHKDVSLDATANTSHKSSVQTGSGDESDNRSDEDLKTFSDMYNILPKLMPTSMAENLSIPLAFTCLLHLANEKSLQIVASSDMSDLCITEPISSDGIA